MKRTIELDQDGESRLYEWAKALGAESEEETLQALTTALLETTPARLFISYSAGSGKTAVLARLMKHLARSGEAILPIRSTPDVMGGDACIRNTRIPVWTLVDYKRQGLTDSELLAAFPSLNASDLAAAWDYYAARAEEVDAQKRRHEDAA
jgi:uncharacterized protein (DUF433 family)